MESITNQSTSITPLQSAELVFSVRSLNSYLAKLKDSRKRRGIRYSVATILVILILAKLCGQNKAYGIADWAQERSDFLINALH